MSDISKAIKAKQTEVKKLQADIEALQRAVSIMGGNRPTAAKPKHRRRKMSAAAKKVLSKRMKAYWTKKKKKTAKK